MKGEDNKGAPVAQKTSYLQSGGGNERTQDRGIYCEAKKKIKRPGNRGGKGGNGQGKGRKWDAVVTCRDWRKKKSNCRDRKLGLGKKGREAKGEREKERRALHPIRKKRSMGSCITAGPGSIQEETRGDRRGIGKEKRETLSERKGRPREKGGCF